MPGKLCHGERKRCCFSFIFTLTAKQMVLNHTYTNATCSLDDVRGPCKKYKLIYAHVGFQSSVCKPGLQDVYYLVRELFYSQPPLPTRKLEIKKY